MVRGGAGAAGGGVPVERRETGRESSRSPEPGANVFVGPAGVGTTARPGGGGDRSWGWWAPVFVVAFVASIVAGGVLQTGESLYLPEASVAQLRDFYGGNATAVLAQSALQLLAAVALYRFGRRLRAALPGAGPRAATALTWGTALAAGALVASVLCALVLLPLATSAGEAVVAGLGRAALLFGGALHLLGTGALITAASVLGWRARSRPRWVLGYGLGAGPLVAASALSAVVPPLVRPEPAFRLLAMVWLVGVAVGVLRGRLAAGSAPEGETAGRGPGTR
ncbi:hypothetical protein AB0J86_24800 [Micromonospora sp. NPDC049559]|uniref:hypothetical protein n=1 Tax=Micromonospora sp. NPDC049559 TaxID=3155923 RepID=UPI003441333F